MNVSILYLKRLKNNQIQYILYKCLEDNMENVKKETIKIEGKKWTDAIEAAVDKALKNANMPGFRKGHVPKDVFLKKNPKEAFYMDAANACLNDAYMELLKKNKDLELVAEPQIDIKIYLFKSKERRSKSI